MSKKVRVLNFSTHNEDCGIAKYQEQFVRGMEHLEDVEIDFFEYSPNQTKKMSDAELQPVIDKLGNKLGNYDILHIQYELSFFSRNELTRVIETAKALGKKVIVTVHTAPAALIVVPHFSGYHPRNILNFARQKRAEKMFIDKYITPLLSVDRIIVHNESTKQNLVKYGVSGETVRIIRHPVPAIFHNEKSTEVRQALNHKEGDIIFASVGFLSASKGVVHAIKALTYLPKNYKLAILGGVHPDATDTSLLDELTDIIHALDLKERVYISGFIEDDNKLNAKVREVDLCVYPYDKRYYSFVSSGSLNIAIANHRPVVAYHTASFDETNLELDVVAFAKSPNYYELARSIRTIDLSAHAKNSQEYAKLYNWDTEAVKFTEIYRDLLS